MSGVGPAPTPGLDGLGPVAAAERIVFLDILRGFALFGIFVANLPFFAGWHFRAPGTQRATALGEWNGTVEFWIHHMLVDGKFYTIFSLLFGIGFALQMTRAAERGTQFVPLFRRRLAVLLCIGLVHLLLWPGDILVLYALVGFLVIAFRNVSDRAILLWSLGLMLSPLLFYGVMVAAGGTFTWGAPLDWAGSAIIAAVGGRGGGTPFDMIARGGFGEVLGLNVIGSLFRWSDLLYSSRPQKVLAMFLLGLWVGRRGVAFDLERHAVLLRRALLAGLAIGLPFNWLLARSMERRVYFPPSAAGLLETLYYAVGVAPLGIAYAAGLALLWRAGRMRGLLTSFAPVGRMAVSNYLFQTLAGIGLMYGIGLGWAAATGPAVIVPVAAAVFVFQIGASTWWLRRWEYGPVEWVWRQATYRRRMRLRSGVVAADG